MVSTRRGIVQGPDVEPNTCDFCMDFIQEIDYLTIHIHEDSVMAWVSDLDYLRVCSRCWHEIYYELDVHIQDAIHEQRSKGE